MDAKVAEVLAERPRTTASPRTVRFGLQDRAAAWFEQVREVPPGSRAYAEGEREFLLAGLYVLGELPLAYQRDDSTVFVTKDGGRWYIAAWADEQAVTAHPEFHPLGVWFLLAPEPEGGRGKADGLTDGAPTFTFELIA